MKETKRKKKPEKEKQKQKQESKAEAVAVSVCQLNSLMALFAVDVTPFSDSERVSMESLDVRTRCPMSRNVQFSE